ncbi:MAG TPA: hypothetical protein ENK55_06580 [Actinobacteria bacterium]|nr:hypothetical protein [Actinomycetota bacterium]
MSSTARERRRYLTSARIAGAAILLAACSPGRGDADILRISATEPVRYATLREVAAASSVVVEGVVVAVRPHRIVGDAEPADGPEPFEAYEVSTIDVEVARVLAGTLDGDRVSFPWMTREKLEDGEPGRRVVVNGLPPPEVGDRYLLFLREILPADAESTGSAPPTHAVVVFESLLRVDRGRLASDYEGGRFAADLVGRDPAEVVAEVADAVGTAP